MGKSKRIRADRAEDLMSSPERYSDIKAAKKAKKTSVILICIIAAIILASVALVIFNETGALDRSRTLYESENFEINGAMAKYMYMNVYQQYYAMYGQYAQYFMPSNTTDLIGAKTILARCEAAKAAGYELTEEDKDAIDADIKELKKTLKENGSSISKMFGEGVLVKDIRDVMELQKLASKIYSDKETEFTDKILADTDRINKYFGENKTKFLIGDYIKVSVNEEYFKKFEEAKEKEDFSAEDFKMLFIEYYVKENLLTNYNSKAGTDNKVEALDASVFEAVEAIVNYYVCEEKDDKIKDVTFEDVLDMDEVSISKDKFKEVYTKFKADGDKTTEAMYENLGKVAAEMCDKVNKAITVKEDYAFPEKKDESSSSTTTTTAGTTTAATTTAGAAAQADEGTTATTTTAGATTTAKPEDKTPTASELSEAFDKWFFDEKDERKEGDIYTAEDGKTVYYVVEPATKETYITKNVGHILIEVDSKADDATKAEAKKKAEDLLNQFKSGEKTKDAFEALGEANTADSNVFYENVVKGKMVAEFEDWIYDEARKAGDTGIVETTYGYHVMYFVGDGLEAWEVTALDSLLSEDLNSWNTEITTAYPVTVVEKNVTKIFG